MAVRTIRIREKGKGKFMADKNAVIAEQILPLVGGEDNIAQATHCMTRLRLNLKDYGKADIEEIKKIDGVATCLNSGGQLQIVIGTNVTSVYDEFCKIAKVEEQAAIDENLDAQGAEKEKGAKAVVNSIFAFLSGTMTNLIPIMIAASLCKTIVAVFGPQLLGIMPEDSDPYKLFTFMGDAGFYFLPVFIAVFAAKKLNISVAIAAYLATIMIHPTFVQIATDEVAFTVFGIPCNVQNYSTTVLPILLVVWIMSYVERFVKKYTPDVLKVIVVPFVTVIVMTPLALCVLGPLGAFLGNYVSSGIIALYDLVGPLAVAILGRFFGCIVMTGMHQLLFVYLFTTFPMLGYDGFMIPGMLAGSWASLGVALACILKFKKKENKSTTVGFIITWLFGGVGEPMLYGLNLRFRTSLYASIIAGMITGFVSALFGLKAYVLTVSNGIYGLAAFLGGPKSNYVAMGVMLVVAVVSGFITMMFFPINEEEAA